MDRPAIVVFGAAVQADGRPSPSLRRRIGYGAEAAAVWPDAPILCSGGVGAAGPSEASVIREGLLSHGIAAERLVLDEESLDTLQSAVATVRFVRRRGLDGAVICSDRYHVPRIRMLLEVLGVRGRAGPTAPGFQGTRPYYVAKMYLREALAIPYDLAIVLVRRAELLALTR
ncbi:YdcF family protein [Phenylobacterium sp.]|uniref:YdcF family protein n=1 Tax=Phenylobacterium sp. TaxID=1871053 RepID=UPI003567F2CB